MQIVKASLLLSVLCVFNVSRLLAQEDLLSLVEDKKDEPAKKVYATFKTVRIGNAQTIETVKKKHLDFRISHRFGNVYDANLKNAINETFQTYLGLDNATDIRVSFDYGVMDNLSLGIARSKFNKLLEGNMKWKLLEQKADFSMPVTLAYFGCIGYTHAPPTTIYAGLDRTELPTNELHRFN